MLPVAICPPDARPSYYTGRFADQALISMLVVNIALVGNFLRNICARAGNLLCGTGVFMQQEYVEEPILCFVNGP